MASPAPIEANTNTNTNAPGVWSFKTQLALWFGSVSLLVLLSVGLYGGWGLTQATTRAHGEALRAAAESAADLLGANLRERELEIHLLSQAPHLVRAPLDSPAVLKSLTLRKELRGEYAWLGVTDAKGTVLQAVDGLLVGRSVAERDWFRAAARGVFVGDVHLAKLLAMLLPPQADGEPLRFIDFAAPIRGDDGQLRGVIGAHVHWNWVTNTVKSAVTRRQLDESVDVLIIDRQGRVLYPQRLSGQQGLLPSQEEQPRFSDKLWSDGQRYLSSEVQVRSGTAAELGWRIVLRQPYEMALEPVQAQIAQLLLLGLIAAGACALVAYWLAVRLSRPLSELAEAAARVEHGDRQAVFPALQPIDELRRLGRALRGMTESLLRKESELERANVTLEAAVLQRTQALEAANAELARLATRDALTGVFNRRWFDEKLVECLQTARRSGEAFSLMLIDADHFKRVNDNFGHGVGDQVLQRLAELLLANTRATDCVARIGGEEFALLMPGSRSPVEALVVGEKLRAAVAAASFPSVGRVTISAGLTLSAPGDNDGATLLARADLALYRAKAEGRNRVDLEMPTQT